MRAGPDALAGMCDTALYMGQRQPPGARIGPGSNANYWADATLGAGPDWQNNRTFVFCWWRSGTTTNNQTLWSYTTATSGWRLIVTSVRTLTLTFLGAGGGSNSFVNSYLGLNVVAITQKNDGTRRFSCSGGEARALTSPGTYNVGAATAVHSVLKDQGLANFAATQQSLLWQGVIDADLTDADLVAISNRANQLDRWNVPDIVSGHAALRWLADWKQWDGASATFTGTGSAPYTLTRAGTGGGKTVLPAYTRWRVPPSAVWDSQRNDPQGATGQGGGIQRSTFDNLRFVSSSDDTTDGPSGVVLDIMATFWNLPGCINLGLKSNGTALPCNNLGAQPVPGIVQPDDFALMRSVDCGVPAGAGKNFDAIGGLKSKSSGAVITAGTVMFVRVVEGTAFQWVERAAPADCEVYLADSLFEQVQGLTEVPGILGPPYTAYPMLARAAGGRRVSCEGHGFGTWHERISTAQLRAELVALLVSYMWATGTNWLWLALGTNDFGLNTYASLVTFEADLVAFLQLLELEAALAGIPGFKCRVAGPTDRTGSGVPNGSGWTLPQMVTAQSNAVTTVGSANITFVDAFAFVTAGNRPDGLHYSVAGHAEYFAAKNALGPPP